MQDNSPSAVLGVDSSYAAPEHLQLPAQLKLGLDAVAAATTRPQDLAANMSDDQFFEGVTQALRSKSVPFPSAPTQRFPEAVRSPTHAYVLYVTNTARGTPASLAALTDHRLV